MQILANALIAGSLAALIAGGLALVYGTLGVFNLALGQMVLIGGYVTWWLYQVIGAPLLVSILGGLFVGSVVSWIVFETFVAPFYKRHRFLPLVTTIALSMILDGIILMLFKEQPRAIFPGIKDTFTLFGAIISTEQIILILLTLMLLCVFAYVLHSTAFGRRIRAVVQHDHAALSLGIPAPLLHRLLFIMSGFLAACGGIFIGIDQNLTPTLGFALTIKAYAAIIAGGKGNFWGAIFCAYLIELVSRLAIGIQWFGLPYLPIGYQNSIALLFIILVLLFKPAGLFARAQRNA